MADRFNDSHEVVEIGGSYPTNDSSSREHRSIDLVHGSNAETVPIGSSNGEAIDPPANNQSIVNERNRLEHETDREEPIDSSAQLISTQLRERGSEHIKRIGRSFNILDRLFRRSDGTSRQRAGILYGFGYDGVFSNMSAKPEAASSQGETEQQDIPPTYDEAAADMAPSYYGMNLNGTGDLGYDDICIEGLPVGNMANFLWNLIVSTSFQFIGFLITYILHTSHAAKQGSRFGLGLTFIGYSYSMIPNNVMNKIGKNKTPNRVDLSDPNEFDDLDVTNSQSPPSSHQFQSNLNHGLEEETKDLPFLAVVVGFAGLFLSIKSIYNYIQVKKLERKYLEQERV